jgi:hypothetical protein
MVKDWKETSRYETKSEKDAQDMFKAVSHEPDGVFSWIRSRW